MRDLEFHPDDFFDEPIHDAWAEGIARRLAGALRPLEVQWLRLSDARDHTLAEWGQQPQAAAGKPIWEFEEEQVTLQAEVGNGRVRLSGEWSDGETLRRIETVASSALGAVQATLSAIAPSFAHALAVTIDLHRQHEVLVKSESRVRQLRTEQAALKTKQDQLIKEVLAEHELRMAQERDLAQRLEAEVVARTEQLALEKERAERASKVRDLLLSNMSHELRTPLTAILGFVEILLDEDTDAEESRGFLETIQRSALRLLGLVDDVLQLSHLASADAVEGIVECDPRELVPNALEGFPETAADKGLVFSIENDEPLPAMIATDPNRFRQVLRALVHNAVKFTTEGSVRVTLASEGSPPQRRLSVAVADTGPGIAPQQLETVFEPFQQADISTTRKFGGVGLGLSVARRTAELLGGEITVESTLGKGSAFRLLLPLQPPQTESPTKRPSPDQEPLVGAVHANPR